MKLCKECRKIQEDGQVSCQRCLDRKAEQEAIPQTELEEIWWGGFLSDIDAENPYTKNYPEIEDVKERVWWRVTDKRADYWQEGHRTCWEILSDYLGEIAQQNAGGISSEEYEKISGKKRNSWQECEEHQRQDYRTVAEQQLRFLMKHDLLNIDKMKVLIMTGKLSNRRDHGKNND